MGKLFENSLKLFRYVPSFAGLLISACALTPAPIPEHSIATQCLALYEAMDQAVANHGTTPSSPVKIEGFPYLRVNRFLASFQTEAMNQDERAAWLSQLAELDGQARRVEYHTLPSGIKKDLTRQYAAPATLGDALTDCARTLQNHDLNDPNRFAVLGQRTVVPSAYQTLYQIVGLYPLMALPVQFGVSRWQQETQQVFQQPLENLAVKGTLRRFRPAKTKDFTDIYPLPQDALGIPDLSPRQLADLFVRYAPIWEIDVMGNYDLPGAPVWRKDGVPTVDTTQNVVYHYASYTRWQNVPLLQLNYVVWFSERPRTSRLDLLGGPLDGLMWRVTLNRDGEPLLYDTIHPCGCYHLFFPTESLQLRPTAQNLMEPPLVAQSAPVVDAHQRIVVRIASASHYVQRIYADTHERGSDYRLQPYEALYRVKDGNQRRSLFAADGLVPGTERGERWLLWPMGIPSPGAMRERGHHATAFVGRRHFDDPDLLDHLFEPTN